MLFQDDDTQSAVAACASPVALALRSERALSKIATRATEEEEQVHSFASLLTDLAIIVATHVQPNDTDLPAFMLITTPTLLQRRTFGLLGISHRLDCV
jgi:hypothetical protein